jgi:hypothetical protein
MTIYDTAGYRLIERESDCNFMTIAIILNAMYLYTVCDCIDRFNIP